MISDDFVFDHGHARRRGSRAHMSSTYTWARAAINSVRLGLTRGARQSANSVIQSNPLEPGPEYFTVRRTITGRYNGPIVENLYDRSSPRPHFSHHRDRSR